MPVDAEFLFDWIEASIRLATPLVLVAMGGVFAERSGVFNIGMEGMMLTGAFVAVTGSYYTDNVLLAAVTAMLAGGVLSLVHAYVTITRRANQIISGAAINLFALGLTNFLYRALLGSAGRKRVEGFPQWKIPVLGDIPVVGPLLFDQSVIAYVAYVAPLVFAWVLFRTTWGLNVRAVGEYPLAADTAGVSVPRVRYLSVFLSGMMAGLGGAALALGAVRYFTPGMTAGRGFIVLGAIIFGKWNPVPVALACLFFGAADAFQLRAQTFGFEIPHQFLLMLPYLLTIAAMVGFIGRTRQPESLGIPYDGQGSSA
jgi:ABC-type uncharacterized transport system permease subunit